MGLFSKLFKDSLGTFIKSATLEELEDAYEVRRQQGLKDGGGDRTPEMERLNRAISKKAAELWEKDPRRNTDPNFRWTDANRWDKD